MCFNIFIYICIMYCVYVIYIYVYCILFIYIYIIFLMIIFCLCYIYYNIFFKLYILYILYSLYYIVYIYIHVTCNVPCAVVWIRGRWHCFLVATKLFCLCQSGGFLWCCKWFSAHQNSSRGPVVNLMILNQKWIKEDHYFCCFSPFLSKQSWGFTFSSLFITICILYLSYCLRQSQLQQEMRLYSWIIRWWQLKY